MPAPAALDRLDRARERVAAEEEVRPARQVPGLDHPAGLARQRHLRARRDVEARLDHAVVADRDAEARVRAEEAAASDRDPLRAAAGEGAHDRGAAADVGAVADDDALRDPALHHRGAEGAGVVVDEALVHDDGPGREVGAEPHARGVGDPHARRHDVVGHPREPVEALDVDAVAPEVLAAEEGRLLGRHGAPRGPEHDRQHAEDPVEVDRVRRDQAVGQQMEAQVGVGRRRRRRVEVDPYRDRSAAHPQPLVLAGEAEEVDRGLARVAVAELRAPGTRCRGRCRRRRRWRGRGPRRCGRRRSPAQASRGASPASEAGGR